MSEELDRSEHNRQQPCLRFPRNPIFRAFSTHSNLSNGRHTHGWDVLLDAATFTPTNRLDLSRHKPDFVSQSFYKIFGYPTGVGVYWIAKREALKKLHRPWFAGGTITVASVQGDKFYMSEGEAAFEDGTLNYLTIPAVEIGLKHIQAVGYDLIHDRVVTLGNYLLGELNAMHHATARPSHGFMDPPIRRSAGAHYGQFL